MSRKIILGSAVLIFCIIGMLAAPAAAAPAGQGTTTANAVDPGLKDDLWNNHQQNRLETFDLNVRHAQSVIDILEKYRIDTTAYKATISTISSRRPALESALTHRDIQGLKNINAELKTLWRQFIKVRDAIRDRYSNRAGDDPAGIVSAGLGLPTV